MTLGRLIDLYLAARPNSTAQRWSLTHVRRTFGDLSLERLSHVKLSGYSAERLANETATGTLRRELGALKACIAWGRKQRLHEALLPDIELPPEGAPRTRTLTVDEEERFRGIALTTSRVRLSRLSRFVCLGLDCGARKEAIQTLTWDRVNLDAGYVDFELPGRAQTVKRRAKAPIPPRLVPVLARARKEATSLYVLDHPGNIRKSWETCYGDTVFSDVRPHDLRRTFITLSIEAGVNIEAVARIVGDDPDTLRKHYAHHQPAWLQDEMSKRWGS